MKFLKIMLFFCFLTQAQQHKLNRVTVDELKQKNHPSDTTASAAILFQEGTTNFFYNENVGFGTNTRIIIKIKIYKKEGLSYGIFEQAYKNHNENIEDVTFSNVTTYNLVDGKISKTKIKSEGIVDIQKTKEYAIKKIIFPDVKVGSILEFEMVFKTPRISTLYDWEFQKDIPVDYSEYITEIPQYFAYNVFKKGYLNYISKTTEKNRSIAVDHREGNYNHAIPATLAFTEKVTSYSLRNIPALKDEMYVNNIENYRSKILYELSGELIPGEKFKSFSADWESVAKTIYKEERFGNEIIKTSYFENDLLPLLKKSGDKADNIKIVLNFVQSRMHWNEKHRTICSDNIEKAYQNKVGNSAEINLMLIAMLRFAEIEANPILVSTRSNGESQFPSYSAFNHVIAGIETPDGIQYLDATSKNSTLNIIPFENLNWKGRILRRNDTSDFVNLIPQKNALKIIKLNAIIDSNGLVNGTLQNQLHDYNAFGYREEMNTLSKESAIEKIEREFVGMEVLGYEVQNKKEVDLPIEEEIKFNNNNVADVIDGKIYCNALLFLSETKNPFSQEKREFPVDFIFPKANKFIISLTIPQGYKVDKLPEPINIVLGDNIANFNYNITTSGNQIQILAKYNINRAIINPDNYNALKEFYSKLIAKNSDKIIISKI